jgi:surface polysaccharide O-acyltransferase-like enzyme
MSDNSEILHLRSAMMTPYLSQKIKILSLFAMLMVVMVHAYNNTEHYLVPFSMITDGWAANRYVQLLIANGLTRWGIPLFFLISGYLNYPSEPRPYKVLVRKRLRSLLVPYLLWSLVGLGLYWIVQHNELLWQATVKAQLDPYSDTKIADYNIGQFLVRWLFLPIPFQLWFLRCLLVYALLTPLLLRRLEQHVKPMFIVFGLLWFSNFGLYIIEGDGLLFFSLGLWLRMKQIDVQIPPKWFQLGWITAGWLGVLLLKTALAFGSYDGIGPTVQLFLFRIAQATGVLVIWFGYDWLMRGRLPAQVWLRLSAFSFIIYGLHVPMLHIIENALLIKLGESQEVLCWVYWGTSFGIIGICIVVGMLLKYLIPALFGLLTGGRGLN